MHEIFQGSSAGEKKKVPFLKNYAAYRGKSITVQSFIRFLPETVPDGAV